ncbi:MAG: type II toxin-antitoxin system HicB family antitoxin [Acidobacteriota bacterium]|nr:type II toxin-antitoxin system HicB family antitoxin [Acidobacteriota bacterium]
MHKYGFQIFWSDEDDAYIVTCPEFPGLSAFGDTEEEALREAKVALELFIESMQEHGEPLPVPRPAHTHSGQFRVRIPRTLHRQLAERAEEEGVSLNSLVMTYLSAGIAAACSARPAQQTHFAEHLLISQHPVSSPQHLEIHTRFDRAEVEERGREREVINFHRARAFSQTHIEELALVS